MHDLTVIMSEHLALMDADGLPHPPATNKLYSGKLALRIDPDVHRALAARATASHDSLNRHIERILAASLVGRDSRANV